MPAYQQAQKRWRSKSGHGGEPMEKEPTKEPYITPEVKSEEVALAYGGVGGCGCSGNC
jgi:hypothetical protein